MRKHKISLDKVQEAFNAAIKRRDKKCMIDDFDPCCGQLECSHFYGVSESPALRFYPPNAYAQCHLHHWRHHHGKGRKYWYDNWMTQWHFKDKCRNLVLKFKSIKYTDELKLEIIRLCNADKLDELKELIEENIK